MKRTLLISDLHLTDSPNDEYRWKLWPWVREIIKKECIEQIYCLGDVFDRKDKHPARLVNRLVQEITDTRDRLPSSSFDTPKLTILLGNHDYLKVEHPFLEFLGEIPQIKFLTKITQVEEENRRVLFLPHSRHPENDWSDPNTLNKIKRADFIFIHQGVIGVRVSNYYEMKEGLDSNFFNICKPSSRIYSGDIHLPQVIKNITYIGTQHPVSFGDEYEPRALIIADEYEKELKVPTIKRLHIKIQHPDEIINFDLRKSDQVKVTIMLEQSEVHNWQHHKKIIIAKCQEIGVEIHDLKLEVTNSKERIQKSELPKKNILASKEEVFRKFAESEKLGEELIYLGLKLMKGD